MPVKKPKAPVPQYHFRRGFRSPVSPDVIAVRLEYLRAQLGRAPNGKDVLEDARPVGAPLHEHFEWNNDVAAERYRVRQANELVAAVRIIVIRHNQQVFQPAYIPYSDTDTGRRGFINVQVATAPPCRERTLADVIRRYWLTASRDRTLGYDELEPLFELLDGLYEEHCT